MDNNNTTNNNCNAHFWGVNNSYEYSFANNAHATFIGKQANELLSTHINNLSTTQDYKILQNDYLSVFSTKKELTAQHILTNSDGIAKQLTITYHPQLNSQGSVEQILCSAVETELFNNENFKDNTFEIVDKINESVCILKKDLTHLYANKAAANSYGLSQDVMMGFDPREFAAPNKNNMDDIIEKINNVFSTGISTTINYWANDVNGKLMLKRLTVNKSKYNNEDIVVISSRDITEQHYIKSDLEASEDRFKTMVDNTNSIIVITDFDGNIKYTNNKTCEYAESCMLSSHNIICKFLIPDSERELITQKRLETIEKGEIELTETKLFSHDKKILDVQMHSKIINYSGEDVILYAFRDITEIKAKERELKYESDIRQTLIDLSVLFRNPTIETADEIINESLKAVCSVINADRAFLFNFDSLSLIFSNTHEYCGEGIEPHMQSFKSLPFHVIKKWLEMYDSDNFLVIPNITEYNDTELSQIIEKKNVKSMSIIPLMHKGKFYGMVGIDYVKDYHDFKDAELEMLKIFAEKLVNMTLELETKKEIQRNAELRNRLIEISNSSVNLKIEDAATVINDALSSILDYFDADASYIISYNEIDDTFSLPYIQYGDDMDNQFDKLQEVKAGDAFGPIISLLRANKVGAFSSLDQSPTKESGRILSQLGINSLALSPLLENGKWIGVVGVSYKTRPHEFTNSEIETLRLFAQTIFYITTELESKKEIRRNAELRNRLIEISNSAVNLKIEDAPIVINEALSSILDYFDADASYIISYDDLDDTFSLPYIQYNEGMENQFEKLQNVKAGKAFGPIIELLRANKVGVFSSLNQSPTQESGKILSDLGINSLALSPLLEKDKWIGVVGVSYKTKPHQFTDSEIETLRLFAQTIFYMLTRIKSENITYKFMTAMEQTPIGITIVDSKGRIEYTNSFISNISGYSKDELLGTYNDTVANGILELLGEDGINTIAKGETWQCETQSKRKDDTDNWLKLTITPIAGNNGFISISDDITERKLMINDLIYAKEKAEESDRLKSAFLANMSHEIRSPLNGVIAFASLIQTDPDMTADDVRNYVEIIHNSGNHLLNIINDIVYISKFDAGFIKPVIATFNLNSVMTELYQIFDTQVKNKSSEIDVVLNLSSDKFEITSDETRIRQVIENLLSNALKFTSSGIISFGYEIKDSHLMFYVKDTGIGIRKEKQDQIFERFVQASDTTEKLYGGTGLGLSICKATTEMLGGKMWLESQPYQGTTFYFTIPL